jgi:hypothetical protein
LFACDSEIGDSNNQCQLLELKICKEFKNKKIKIHNQEIDLFISYKDTLESITKIDITINKGKKKSVYIFEKTLLVKEYQDKETLLLSNLEKSFKFGKDKPIYTAGTSFYSTTSVNGKYNPKYRLNRFSGYGINFFESGRFVDTYYISFNNSKNACILDYCTVRLRDLGDNFLLEKVVLSPQSVLCGFLIN